MKRNLLVMLVLTVLILMLSGCASGTPLAVTVTQTVAPTPTPAPLTTATTTPAPITTTSPTPLPPTTTPTPPSPPAPPSPPTPPSPPNKPTATTKTSATPSTTQKPTAASWKETSAPSNINVSGATWINIDASAGKTILAAVFYPQGNGPFPSVVFLHGTYGFQLSDVTLARDFAKAGFIGVAAGWFGGHWTYPALEPITSLGTDAIVYSNGPDIKDTQNYVNNILAILGAVRTLPKVKNDCLGLIGHSRGSAVSITTAASGADVIAVVALAGYPDKTPLDRLKAPILILQGTSDQTISVENARTFESTLKSLNKTVEAYYYEGAPHTIQGTSPWREDVLQRASVFFTKYLVP